MCIACYTKDTKSENNGSVATAVAVDGIWYEVEERGIRK